MPLFCLFGKLRQQLQLVDRAEQVQIAGCKPADHGAGQRPCRRVQAMAGAHKLLVQPFEGSSSSRRLTRLRSWRRCCSSCVIRGSRALSCSPVRYLRVSSRLRNRPSSRVRPRIGRRSRRIRLLPIRAATVPARCAACGWLPAGHGSPPAPSCQAPAAAVAAVRATDRAVLFQASQQQLVGRQGGGSHGFRPV